jgi:hypothetical protein
MTGRETQKVILEKYISCMSGLIGKAIRERRPYTEIEALQQDHNRAVLKLEEIEFRISIGQK